MNASSEWRRIESAFDQLLDLPPGDRRAAITRLADGDVGLVRELNSLLDQVGTVDTRLDRPAISPLAPIEPTGPWLSAGRDRGRLSGSCPHRPRWHG